MAAYKLKKPVRAVLDRDEDMQVTGYRHPCLIKYRAAFDDEGKIIATKFEIYVNAGYSMDISCSVSYCHYLLFAWFCGIWVCLEIR